MVVRHTPESTLKALSKVTDSVVCQTPEEVESASKATVSRQKHNDVWYLFVSSDNKRPPFLNGPIDPSCVRVPSGNKSIDLGFSSNDFFVLSKVRIALSLFLRSIKI